MHNALLAHNDAQATDAFIVLEVGAHGKALNLTAADQEGVAVAADAPA